MLANLWCFSIHMKKYAIGPISFKICSFCIIVVPVCIPSAAVLLLLFFCAVVLKLSADWVLDLSSLKVFFYRSQPYVIKISSRHRLHIALSLFPCYPKERLMKYPSPRNSGRNIAENPDSWICGRLLLDLFPNSIWFLAWLRASLPLQGKRTRRKATCTVYGGNYTKAGLKVNRKRRYFCSVRESFFNL